MPRKPAHRLYVAEPLSSGTDVRLDEERSHYAGRVLRLKAGDEVTLFDGRGGEFSAAILEVTRRGIVVRVGGKSDRSVESPLGITLVQGVSRGERMDFVVQKATELGVLRITPVMTGRSVVQLADDKSAKRARHWAKVAQSACEQCGRNVVPVVDSPQPFGRWLSESTPGEGQRLMLHPGGSTSLAGAGLSGRRCDLLVGPEGGFGDAEAEQAVAAGFVPCSLGRRILRTETAAVAALAILQSLYGDLQ